MCFVRIREPLLDVLYGILFFVFLVALW